ncbi:hypothetical protein KL942_001343 [Ogataea angusta]|uniref:RRM domain-containing protein n=1 Tax=Pichia angusta TaxID=870730 RepID=A0ABQ7S1C1_PICAN|nr:hypothetical protein KL942_001343 [Ogataea angusta]KAG7850959.1 hypothetical protein KL940_001536 [Ogataea angusta]
MSLKAQLQLHPTSFLLWRRLLEESPTDENYQLAYYRIQFDVTNNYKMWGLYYKHCTAKVHEAGELDQLWLQQLQIPSLDYDSLLNDYSKFVSDHFGEQYTDKMKNILQIKKKVTQILEKIEPWELHRQDRSPDYWIGYLKALHGSKVLDRVTKKRLIQCTVERSLGVQVFVPVIQTYLSFNLEVDESAFWERVVQIEPYNAEAWIQYIRDSPVDQLQRIRSQFNSHPDLILVPVFCEILRMELRLFKQNASVAQPLLMEDTYNFFSRTLKAGDIFHTVPKLCIEIQEDIGDVDGIRRNILTPFLENFDNQTEAWLYVAEFEKRHGNYRHVTDLFKKAMGIAEKLDWPERLASEWKRFELLKGTDESQEYCDEVCKRALTRIKGSKRRLSEHEVEEKSQGPHSKRRAHEDTAETKPRKQKTETRDREHLTVLVANLPPSIDEKELTDSFSSCGKIRSFSLLQGKATIEFTDEQGLLSAMKKNGTIIEDSPIEVVHLQNNTLWVANYPPEKTAEDLRNIFGQYGEILSVRLPSLKSNVQRRFCYVEYSSEQDAASAVKALDGHTIRGKTGDFKLTVKVSNPDARQDRKGALEEGRQVYVSDLDFYKVDEDRLSELFSKFGDIEMIRIPVKRDEKIKKLNNGFAFISFKSSSDAVNSLELDGNLLAGRPMKVELATPKKKKVSVIGTGKFDRARTISVLNVDDKLNTENLKAIFEEIGPVTQIELQPENNAALIEFETVRSSGMADFKFNGRKIGDTIVRIGTFQDFLKLKRNKT